MHLLYLDDSGSVGDAKQDYVVLAGLSLFERRTHWLEQELNAIAARFNASDPYSIELHGSPMFVGRGQWRRVPRGQRIAAINDALKVLRDASASVRVFGIAVHKPSMGLEDPIEYAFEQVCSRFDRMLMRHHYAGDTQRGVIVFDKSAKETSIQGLAREFKIVGHRWGVLRNMAEVPMFIDSRASRLVQLADLIAYGMFRYFEFHDAQFFDIFKSRFDAVGGIVHGLHHRRNFAAPAVITTTEVVETSVIIRESPGNN